MQVSSLHHLDVVACPDGPAIRRASAVTLHLRRTPCIDHHYSFVLLQESKGKEKQVGLIKRQQQQGGKERERERER